ncbi:MAG: hypothetical protein ACKPB7_08400 [Sphaerospermopsis kisseleviana]
MATKSEKFMWGFERLSWAFKLWVRLIKGTASKELFYNYLESPSSDK